jgi:hypothetical protein
MRQAVLPERDDRACFHCSATLLDVHPHAQVLGPADQDQPGRPAPEYRQPAGVRSRLAVTLAVRRVHPGHHLGHHRLARVATIID